MSVAIPAPLASRLLREISVQACCGSLDNFGLMAVMARRRSALRPGGRRFWTAVFFTASVAMQRSRYPFDRPVTTSSEVWPSARGSRLQADRRVASSSCCQAPVRRPSCCSSCRAIGARRESGTRAAVTRCDPGRSWVAGNRNGGARLRHRMLSSRKPVTASRHGSSGGMTESRLEQWGRPPSSRVHLAST